jgi:NAD(P)-dependent dehydrogenase (short-subunit alcohol dehydrogenase family)
VSDEVLFVTGGGSGIGRSVALLAARRGFSVAVLARTRESVLAVADEARRLGAPLAAGIVCDVTSQESVIAAFEEAENELGPLSGLFANAGIERTGLAHELSLEVWDAVIATNLTGTFLTCRQALRSLLRSGRPGSLVLCGSPASFAAFAAGGASSYSASKGGLSSLMRTLAVDYAKYGIRVNAVVPGATDTPLTWAGLSEPQMAALRKTLSDEIPLGRLADPDEPAEAVLWLLSEQSRYVTGSHLVCDGGILAKASISA